ncbi:glycoside hydrolase family 32 protein [Microbacterium sp. BK668]|uniref:glycoside hydrolase family 32 protein n=1 Tax=Microbacterium sp. BK668 TaxID=2512118 RepID=UPI0010DD6906|nr:glycoside hydrolase family 32 protein [Microbacterium sp. BK668]TDN91474.1 glycosyl hydrolase family 32 [Microbacterium sp. BK668]
MFLGAALRDGTAAALSYASDDLQNWRYDGIALQRSTRETDPVWMGALLECPQIFTIGDRAVMVSSVWDHAALHYAGYAVGSYSEGEFHAETWGRLTYGDSFYAPSLFIDSEGRPCLLFWMRGIQDPDDGWAGAHSVPYLLSVAGGRLVASVHPDLDAHRRDPMSAGEVESTAADIVWSSGDGGRLLIGPGATEISTTWEQSTVTVQTAPGGTASTAPVEGDVRIVVDGPVPEVSSAGGLLGLATGLGDAPLSIRADGGAVEVFALA